MTVESHQEDPSDAEESEVSGFVRPPGHYLTDPEDTNVGGMDDLNDVHLPSKADPDRLFWGLFSNRDRW